MPLLKNQKFKGSDLNLPQLADSVKANGVKRKLTDVAWLALFIPMLLLSVFVFVQAKDIVVQPNKYEEDYKVKYQVMTVFVFCIVSYFLGLWTLASISFAIRWFAIQSVFSVLFVNGMVVMLFNSLFRAEAARVNSPGDYRNSAVYGLLVAFWVALCGWLNYSLLRRAKQWSKGFEMLKKVRYIVHRMPSLFAFGIVYAALQFGVFIVWVFSIASLNLTVKAPSIAGKEYPLSTLSALSWVQLAFVIWAMRVLNGMFQVQVAHSVSQFLGASNDNSTGKVSTWSAFSEVWRYNFGTVVVQSLVAFVLHPVHVVTGWFLVGRRLQSSASSSRQSKFASVAELINDFARYGSQYLNVLVGISGTDLLTSANEAQSLLVRIDQTVSSLNSKASALVFLSKISAVSVVGLGTWLMILYSSPFHYEAAVYTVILLQAYSCVALMMTVYSTGIDTIVIYAAKYGAAQDKPNLQRVLQGAVELNDGIVPKTPVGATKIQIDKSAMSTASK
ncbi:hypothetical protein MP228_007105 [Amoeboaphelidium protococcarum]|nr:hypothetical protein MP228_007105 [Amoeboaphelidium protococcarum]